MELFLRISGLCSLFSTPDSAALHPGYKERSLDGAQRNPGTTSCVLKVTVYTYTCVKLQVFTWLPV